MHHRIDFAARLLLLLLFDLVLEEISLVHFTFIAVLRQYERLGGGGGGGSGGLYKSTAN